MGIEADIDSPFAEAVRRARSQSAFARLIGKSQASVHDRLKSGEPLWAEDVLTVERETGIPRWQLRPDIYPPAEYAQAEQTPPDATLDRRPEGRAA